MKNESQLTKVEATTELLSEMELLQIHGGSKGNGDNYVLANCDHNAYCESAKCGYCAHCVLGCGEPVKSLEKCDATGGGTVAPPRLP